MAKIVAEGNLCLFLIFMLFNLGEFLSSLGIIGCAIYLFVFTKSVNIFNLAFLGMGLFMAVITVCAFKLRRSIHLLGLYSFSLSVLFLFQIILTIIIFAKNEVVVAWA